MERVKHPIDPVYDANSRILILGSFPSVKSRQQQFFYAHPQNRFWRLLAILFKEETPITIEEKKAFLLRNRIALWDVIASCEIEGSSDSSIRNVEANDLSVILNTADIKTIYVNGKTAEKMYYRYTLAKTGRQCIYLPSTSGANAAMNMDRLIEKWHRITEEERCSENERV